MHIIVLLFRFDDLASAMQEQLAAITFISQEVASSRLFFLDPVEEDDFAVVFGGFERCGEDYQIDRQHFPWYCLEFVSHGSGMLDLGEVQEELRPGSFFVYGPGLPQRIVSSPDNPMGKYFVGFTGRSVDAFLEGFEMQPGVVSRCLKSESIRRAFDALIDRGTRKSPLARPLCATIAQQLLMMCRDDAVDSVSIDTPAYATYARAKDFIEKNYRRVTTLEGIAKACDVDAPYLCRLFARFHDESPYQFLTRLRMGDASQMLLAGDITVKAVAETLGFKDAFHFSRVFKSIHHVPPSRFRQSMHPQRQ
jgi:AraC-like DNA-binding protein